MTRPNPPDDPLGPLLSGLQPPAPPPDLRARVLARATAALESEPEPDAWRRLWESRPLRLAWALVVLFLAAANILLPARPGAPPAVASAPGDDPELAASERLPRLRAEYAAAGGGPAVSSPSPVGPVRALPDQEKGSRS